MPRHNGKRRRESDDTSNVDSSVDEHQLFTQWAQQRGVEINGVKAERLPGRGLGLVAARPLKNGERILLIPEKAMFKPDVAMLKRESLQHASPQAQLAISAMNAFKNPQMPLQVWQQTWPTAEDFEQSMPMCWPTSVRQLLPPSVHQPLARQLADYEKDWKAAKSICETRGWSEDEFKYYWMIVNSRSFHWKPPRGKAGSMVMCPFIDYMNHGPSGSGCMISQTAKGYEAVADRDYGK